MLNCKDIESYLLNESHSEEVDLHLKTCSACRLYAELLKEQPLNTPETFHKDHAVKQAILTADIRSKKQLKYQSVLFAVLAFIFLTSLSILLINFSWFGIVYVVLIYTLLPLALFSIKRKDVVS